MSSFKQPEDSEGTGEGEDGFMVVMWMSGWMGVGGWMLEGVVVVAVVVVVVNGG